MDKTKQQRGVPLLPGQIIRIFGQTVTIVSVQIGGRS